MEPFLAGLASFLWSWKNILVRTLKVKRNTTPPSIFNNYNNKYRNRKISQIQQVMYSFEILRFCARAFDAAIVSKDDQIQYQTVFPKKFAIQIPPCASVGYSQTWFDLIRDISSRQWSIRKTHITFNVNIQNGVDCVDVRCFGRDVIVQTSGCSVKYVYPWFLSLFCICFHTRIHAIWK